MSLFARKGDTCDSVA